MTDLSHLCWVTAFFLACEHASAPLDHETTCLLGVVSPLLPVGTKFLRFCLV